MISTGIILFVCRLQKTRPYEMSAPPSRPAADVHADPRFRVPTGMTACTPTRSAIAAETTDRSPPTPAAEDTAAASCIRAAPKSATNCRAHYDDEAPTDHAKTRRRTRSPQTPRRTARTRSLRELAALATLAAFATLMRTRQRTTNPQTQRREASAAATTRSSQDAPISPHPSPATCLLQPAATLG